MGDCESDWISPRGRGALEFDRQKKEEKKMSVKKKIAAIITGTCLLCASFGVASNAAYDSNVDITVGDSAGDVSGGRQITMVGTVEPSVLSVTMPSYIPFNISKAIANQNKVLSPRIAVKNNSPIPVSVYVKSTQVNISALRNTTWAARSTVGDSEIAIGMMKESQENTAPSNLNQAKWLRNGEQNISLANIGPNGEDYLYVVGTLGSMVPENQTFSVVPTMIVKPTLE